MQQQQRATRPQMAAALGLSQVSTNAAVAALEKEGILQPGSRSPSGGGRPVQEYHFNEHYAATALLTATREAHCTQLRCELLNLHGSLIEAKEARFAKLHAESLDEWLDAMARRHRLQRICLPPGLSDELLQHLRQRHSCPVQEYAEVEALAGKRDHTLTLILRRGESPQGAMRHHSTLAPCPLLHLLPLPADWATLDYADHTLVEEMLARLLQLLTCILAPAHIDLHADFWNDRLISRLRYNLLTKLRGIETPPHLHFASISPEKMLPQLRRAVAKWSN